MFPQCYSCVTLQRINTSFADTMKLLRFNLVNHGHTTIKLPNLIRPINFELYQLFLNVQRL